MHTGKAARLRVFRFYHTVHADKSLTMSCLFWLVTSVAMHCHGYDNCISLLRGLSDFYSGAITSLLAGKVLNAANVPSIPKLDFGDKQKHENKKRQPGSRNTHRSGSGSSAAMHCSLHFDDTTSNSLAQGLLLAPGLLQSS